MGTPAAQVIEILHDHKIIPKAKAKMLVTITRSELVRICLDELRNWPGCDGVQEVAILQNHNGLFTVHVVDYGACRKKLADRATRYLQREKLRHYRLPVE